MSKRKPTPNPDSEVEEYKKEEVVKPEDVIVEYKTTTRKSLRELVDKNVIIENIELRTGRKGEFIVVTAVDLSSGEESEYYTFSRVIISELMRYKSLFESGKKLKVRICHEKSKGYLYLCEPTKESNK